MIANPAKDPLFTARTAQALLVECCEQWPSVEVDEFYGLLVDYADAAGIKVIVKGLRAVTDFDYELQMAQMNRHLSSDVVTLFVATKPEYGYLSSSLVKQVAGWAAPVEALVPEPVAPALKEAFSIMTEDSRPEPPPIPGKIIDQIEDLIVAVEEARPVPLSQNVMFNRDDFVDRLRALQEALPEELRAARWMVRQRETYITRTNEKAREVLA